MTTAQRVHAAKTSQLTLGELLRWAARHPHEVPLVNGEFFFITVLTDDVNKSVTTISPFGELLDEHERSGDAWHHRPRRRSARDATHLSDRDHSSSATASTRATTSACARAARRPSWTGRPATPRAHLEYCGTCRQCSCSVAGPGRPRTGASGGTRPRGARPAPDPRGSYRLQRPAATAPYTPAPQWGHPVPERETRRPLGATGEARWNATP
jgi:hypothetical protein